MPLSSTPLKDAEQQLLAFSKLVPNLEAAFQYHLHPFFPGLPADIRINEIYLTGLTDVDEPGQDEQLISHSLQEILNTRYLTGESPAYLIGTSQVYRVPDSTDRQHLIPQIPVAVLETFVDYLIQHLKWCLTNTLMHFWKTPHPGLENRTPREWLRRFFMGLVQAEQSLRLRDQTLSATESQTVLDVLETSRSQDRIDRQHANYTGVYEILIRGPFPALDWPLPGAFVLTRAGTSGIDSLSTNFETPSFSPSPAATNLALLYLPDSGLQAFSSLQALDLELRLRLGDEVQSKALLSVRPTQEHPPIQGHAHSLGYREIHGHVFAERAGALIQAQLANIDHAWASAALNGSANNLDALDDYLSDALSLSRYLKPAAIIQNRYTRLFEKQLPGWLKSAPEAQKVRWRQAVATLSREVALSQAPGMPRAQQSGNKTYLLAFARDRLKQRIREDLGIAVDPDTLVLVTTEALQTGPIIYPLANSGFAAGMSLDRTGPTVTLQPVRRTLSEAALDNVGALDVTFALTATITDGHGNRHPMLSSSYLKSIIRELDIGTAYRDFLNETLLTSEQASWRKERYRALKTAQMRLDTFEARLSGQLSNQQADWVEALLDADTAKIIVSKISTRLLMLRGNPMPGVLLITAHSSTQQQLCYLPEAPDRVWFRTFDNLNELARQLSLPALRDYVLQRTSVLEQAYLNPLLKAGLTDSNIQDQAITEHFLDASYAGEVAFALRNVDEQSTTTREANIQTVKDTVMTVVDIISFALPLKVLIPLSIGRFLYGLYQGVDALRREQDHEAMLHWLICVAHLTDAGSDFAGSQVFASSIRVRSGPVTRAFSPGAASLKTPQQMTLLKGEHYRQGVYELKPSHGAAGEYYLPDANGRLFQATYDRTQDTWLMIDRRMPNAAYKTPSLEVALGQWKANASTPMSNQIFGINTLINQARVSGIEHLRDLPDTQGIYTLNQRHYIQQNNEVFEVSAGVPGPGLHLIIATGSSTTQPVFKIRRNLGSSEWEVKHSTSRGYPRWTALRAGARHISPPLPVDTQNLTLLPREHRAGVEAFIKAQTRNQNTRSATFRDPVVIQASQFFYRLRLDFINRAQTFIHSAVLAPRDSIPQLAQATPHPEILRQIYSRSTGLVVGENHYSVASKKFLIDNMAELAKNDVKTFYLEHLQTDFHQVDLDINARSGIISHKLNKFLKQLYKREGLDSHPAYTFLTLVTAARSHGIRVIALDCASSYNIIGKRDYHLKRCKALSFYGSETIRAHQAEHGAHKWVALVGSTHVNTFEGIPGLAELNGGIGMKVMDTLPGQPTGIGPDKGRVTFMKNGPLSLAFYKTDLRLSVEVSASRTYWGPRQRQEIERLLNQVNQYTFNNHPIDGPTLFHRSATTELIETPLLCDPDGKVYLQRPEWPDVHDVRFAQAQDLAINLAAMGMTYVK